MQKKYVIITAMAVAVAVIVVSCKSTKSMAVAGSDEIEISVPCSGADFFSTKDAVRANGVGESMDQQTAKRIARNAALDDLGSKIGATVKAVIDDYYENANVNATDEPVRRYEGNHRNVINKYISDYRIICEKFTRHKTDNNYKCYLAIETVADEMLRKIHAGLTKDRVLKVNYDYAKFKKTFDNEMHKLEQNYR
jgi:membrane protein involved in colicin uptake